MRGWVKRNLEGCHVGMSLAWWLLDDGGWVAVVNGHVWRVRRDAAPTLAGFETDPDWEEVRFSPPLR